MSSETSLRQKAAAYSASDGGYAVALGYVTSQITIMRAEGMPDPMIAREHDLEQNGAREPQGQARA